CVRKSVHLVLPAGFEFERHKETVRAGLNEVSAAVVEFESHAGLPAMPVDDAPQMVLGVFIAASEQSEVNLFPEQIIQNSDDEIESFLRLDSGNHRDHGPIQMRGIQLEF